MLKCEQNVLYWQWWSCEWSHNYFCLYCELMYHSRWKYTQWHPRTARITWIWNMLGNKEVTVCWNSFEMESSQCNENVWWPFDLTPFYSKDIKRMHLDLKLISILHFYFVWPLNKTQQFRVISRNLRLKIVANCAFGDPNGFILIQVW